jgi:hypothetical protein
MAKLMILGQNLIKPAIYIQKFTNSMIFGLKNGEIDDFRSKFD